MPNLTQTLNPKEKDTKIHKHLNEYLNNLTTTSASTAVSSYTTQIHSEEKDETFFWAFWAQVFNIAEQIPHDDPAQDKLALFIRDLTLVSDDTGAKVWDSRIWTDLPLLSAATREHLDHTSTPSAKTSWHAFQARLLHNGVSPSNQTTAIWMLRKSLEEDTDHNDTDHNLDLTIAATYIEYAGATLAKTLSLRPNPQLDETESRMLRGGDLWKGPSGLTLERWTFWGRRFRELGEDEKTGSEARELALHAASLIEVWNQTLLSKTS